MQNKLLFNNYYYDASQPCVGYGARLRIDTQSVTFSPALFDGLVRFVIEDSSRLKAPIDDLAKVQVSV
uniref:Uncharacterized protein n=1 Tax=Anopheles atroparvus TaxID=41427 RepID=A0AAG5D3Z0_ANOAO